MSEEARSPAAEGFAAEAIAETPARRSGLALPWELLEARVQGSLRLNPAVAVLELRTRLRERRAYSQLACSTIGTCATALTVYWIASASHHYSGGAPDEPLGGTVFLALALAQLTLMLLIVPGYAAATLTVEREKGTLELVQASLLGPADVVSGKLLAAYAYTLMLLLSSLPVASWCLMLGGLDLLDILLAYSYLGNVALGAIALGLLVAAFQRKTAAAFSATTGLLLLGLIGLPALLLAVAGTLDHAFSGDEGTLLVEFWIVLTLGSGLGWWLYVILTRYLDAHARSLATARLSVKGLASLLAVGGSGAVVFIAGSIVLSGSAESALGVLVLLHPHGALLGILQHDLLSGQLPDLFGNESWTGLLIWLATTVFALISGLMLWYFAVIAFRFSWHRELRQAAKE